MDIVHTSRLREKSCFEKEKNDGDFTGPSLHAEGWLLLCFSAQEADLGRISHLQGRSACIGWQTSVYTATHNLTLVLDAVDTAFGIIKDRLGIPNEF